MKKFVTLNEYIASLQKIAETHGEEELMATGACCGVYEGLNSPLSIRLGKAGKERTFYVPAYEEKAESDSLYKDGRLQIAGGTFYFRMKRYDVGSQFGINGGRISKLTIRNERTNKEVVNYDRGWDIKPTTKSAQAALDWVLSNFN